MRSRAINTPSAASAVNAIKPQRTAFGEVESANIEKAAPSFVQVRSAPQLVANDGNRAAQRDMRFYPDLGQPIGRNHYRRDEQKPGKPAWRRPVFQPAHFTASDWASSPLGGVIPISCSAAWQRAAYTTFSQIP